MVSLLLSNQRLFSIAIDDGTVVKGSGVNRESGHARSRKLKAPRGSAIIHNKQTRKDSTTRLLECVLKERSHEFSQFFGHLFLETETEVLTGLIRETQFN